MGSTLVVLLLLVATLLVLRVVYGRRRGWPRGQGPLAVIAQVELAPSQSLYLVRAAGRCLLVGGTGGGLGLIAELDPAQVAAAVQQNAMVPGAGGGTAAQRLRARIFGAVEPQSAAEPVVQADHAVPRHADLKVG